MQYEVRSPVHVHEVISSGQPSFVAAVGPSVVRENVGSSSIMVDPNVLADGGGPPPFGLGLATGPLKSKSYRRSVLGSRLRKGKAQGGNSCSPGCHRPIKRSRRETEEEEVGFGFVGFTDSWNEGGGCRFGWRAASWLRRSFGGG
ncbi:hypothetical protein Hanom_Chr04g00350611 [Helianthus anomalus]